MAFRGRPSYAQLTALEGNRTGLANIKEVDGLHPRAGTNSPSDLKIT